jgi:hypothetical protein
MWRIFPAVDHSAFVSGWYATPNLNGGPRAAAGEAVMVFFYWPVPPRVASGSRGRCRS